MAISYNNVVKYLMMSYCVVSFPFNLARLSGYGFIVVPILDAFLLSMAVLATARLVHLRGKVFSDLKFVTATSIFLIYILVVGFLNHGTSSIAGMRFFLLGAVVYLLIQGTGFYKQFVLSKRFWAIVLLSHVFGLIYYYIFLYGKVYPGIGVQSISYSSLSFLHFGNKFYYLLSIVIIFLEQKRSIFISLFFVMTAIFVCKYFKWRLTFCRTMMLIFFGLALANVLLFLLALVNDHSLINRFNLLNPYSQRFDIFMGSSGRFGEFVSYFTDNPLQSLVLGQGVGFSYVWDLGYTSSQNGAVKEYFHMSLTNYVAAGGAIGFLYYVYLAIKIFDANSDSKILAHSNLYVSFAFFSVLQSLFGFNTAIDPIFWLTLLGPSTLIELGRKKQMGTLN